MHQVPLSFKFVYLTRKFSLSFKFVYPTRKFRDIIFKDFKCLALKRIKGKKNYILLFIIFVNLFLFAHIFFLKISENISSNYYFLTLFLKTIFKVTTLQEYNKSLKIIFF